MGRRQKPRSSGRRATLAWPIIVFGVLLVTAAIVLLTRQGGDGNPQLVVDQQQIDYGYVKFGETRAFEISVGQADASIVCRKVRVFEPA